MTVLGLDSVIAPPPQGAVIVLLLVAGCDALGLLVARRVFRIARPADPPWHRWQAPIIGAMVLAILLYPLALAGLTPYGLLRTLAAGVAVTGGLHLWSSRRPLAGIARTAVALVRAARGFERWVLCLAGLVTIGLGLLALGPVTNADALNYHVGVALDILHFGTMPVHPEWFTSRLAGNGEVLVALGLAVGAKAFGSVLQYVGLLAIGAILWGLTGETLDPTEAERRRPLLVLTAVSAPVLLFMVSTAKPQLLQQAMTTLALALLVAPSRRMLEPGAALRAFSLVCLLTMTAAQAKLSFLMTGGPVGLLAVVLMLKRGRAVAVITVAVLAALLVMLPHVMWTMAHYHAGAFESLVEPLPGGWPGSQRFTADLRAFNDTNYWFPVSLVVPPSLGKLQIVLGVGPLLAFCVRPRGDKWVWVVLGMSAVAVALVLVMGQRTNRFFVEPYFWLLMACALAPAGGLRAGSVRWLIGAQAVVMVASSWFGALTLFPGALRGESRTSIMERSANGYTVMKWLGVVAPADAVVLSEHPSLALSPRPVVSMEWTESIGPDRQEWLPYLRLLRVRGVTHLLHLGPLDASMPLRGCLGEVTAGPEPVRQATRNPYNRGPLIDAYLVEFHSEWLPGCAFTNTFRVPTTA